jgi:hypothetical protein
MVIQKVSQENSEQDEPIEQRRPEGKSFYEKSKK